jgi:quercetin dioxygenase-like cupin family protein
MKRSRPSLSRLCAVTFFAVSAASIGHEPARADGAVEVKGFHSRVRARMTALGQLAELNGKYQLRVTEITIDPEGYMKPHHHLGPGVRCIMSGELTYVFRGAITIYRAGDCFTETGDESHEARNAGATPVVLHNSELLPASLPENKTSLIPLPTAPGK